MDRDVRTALQRLIKEEGGQNAAARKIGISHAHLSDLLKGRRAPGPKVLGPLGFRRVVEKRYEVVE